MVQEIAASADFYPDLIRDFADGVHHQKEEQLLFPRLLERGFSKESGPVAVMLHEHTVGRNYVAGIREGIEMYRKNQRNALVNIRSNMDGYIFLLRSHINKENNILFRMADQSLTARDQAELLDRFGVIESGTVNGDLHRASIDRIALLGKKYLNEYPG